MAFRCVFLDRDGVINRTIVKNGEHVPPAMLKELKIYRGTSSACERLHKAGFLLIMASNQPDVKRGKQSRKNVELINRYLQNKLHLHDIFVCYHDDEDKCPCRKPKPGMLIRAARRWNIDLNRSFMIGDRPKDIEAGKRAGCKTVCVGIKPLKPASLRADYQARTLLQAAKWILKNGAQK